MTPKMKTIPTFPKYAATRDGRIFRARSGEEIPQIIDSLGQRLVTVRYATYPPVTVLVSSLVAETYIGPAGDRATLHKNADPSDNRAENLQYAPG